MLVSCSLGLSSISAGGVAEGKQRLRAALAMYKGETTAPEVRAAIAALPSLGTGAATVAGEWTTVSRPDLPGCMGRDKRGRNVYRLGWTWDSIFQPLELPVSVSSEVVRVARPVGNAGVDRSAPRHVFTQEIAFEAEGRAVDSILMSRGHYPGAAAALREGCMGLGS